MINSWRELPSLLKRGSLRLPTSVSSIIAFTCNRLPSTSLTATYRIRLTPPLSTSTRLETITFPSASIERTATMALDTFFNNKIESMKLEIIQGQAVLRRLEAQRNEYNSRVRLLREELGLLQQPGSYVGEVVKVMGTKKVLVKVHPEGKYGMLIIVGTSFIPV
jgi:26S proteasome regulatory subunit T6